VLGGGLLALALLAVWVQASGDSTAAHGPDGPTAQARVEQAEPAPGGMVGGGELPVMPIDAAQLEAQQSSAMARLTSDARMEAGRSVDVTGGRITCPRWNGPCSRALPPSTAIPRSPTAHREAETAKAHRG